MGLSKDHFYMQEAVQNSIQWKDVVSLFLVFLKAAKWKKMNG